MKIDVEVVVLTGMAGAGRSTAAHALEDLGFLVIDNLPPTLMMQSLQLVATENQIKRIAIVADSRGGKLFETLEQELIVLAECSD
ncbi:MAG: hypothetical protein NT032_05245 [Actinobacteria bacterium]|nr:hypothetical protein [Actinomycetota bacterium]